MATREEMKRTTKSAGKILLILREMKLLSLNFPESISHQDDFGDQEAREDKEDVYSKVAQRKPTFVR